MVGACLLFVGAAQISRPSAWSAAMGALALATPFAYWWHRMAPADRRIVGWVAVAHLSILAIDLAFGVVPLRDSRNYWMQAWRMSEMLLGNPPPVDDLFAGSSPLSHASTTAFLAPISALFALFGPSFPLARLFMTLVGLTAARSLLLGLRLLYPRRLADVATLAYGLWPSVAQLQTDILRDNIVIAGFAYAFYRLLQWIQGDPRARGVRGILGAAAGLSMRYSNIALVPFLLAYVLIWGTMRRARRLIVGGVATALAIALPLVPYTRQYILRLSSLTPQAFWDLRRGWGGGKTEYLVDYPITNWFDVAFVSLLGWILFILVPLPWQTSGDLSWPVVAENLVYYYPLLALAGIGFWGRRRLRGHFERGLVAVLFLAASLVYGVAEANVGTALRHRHQFTWLLLYLAPAGWLTVKAWVGRRLQRESEREAAAAALPVAGCRR